MQILEMILKFLAVLVVCCTVVMVAAIVNAGRCEDEYERLIQSAQEDEDDDDEIR